MLASFNPFAVSPKDCARIALLIGSRSFQVSSRSNDGARTRSHVSDGEGGSAGGAVRVFLALGMGCILVLGSGRAEVFPHHARPMSHGDNLTKLCQAMA